MVQLPTALHQNIARMEDIFYAEGAWEVFADRLTFTGRRGRAIYLIYSAVSCKVSPQ